MKRSTLKNLKRVISILLIFYTVKYSGQVDIKSPQTYNMEKFGNIPISLNTGSMTYNINLFNYDNFYNGKGLSIDLKYFGTGFIPAKKSNYVGLDWSLDFGGVISREVRGLPDDIAPDNLISNSTLYGYLEGVRNCNKTSNDIYNYNYTTLADGNGGIGIKCGSSSFELEQDKFNFNFMGKSGYFFIGNNGTPIIVSEDKNLKIDISGLSSRQPLNTFPEGQCLTKYTEIIITDEDGIKYYFGGNYENLEIAYNLVIDQTVQNKFVINAWNLYKVEYPNSNILQIHYRTEAIDVADKKFCADRNNISIMTKEPFLLLFDHHHILKQTITKENLNYNTSSGNLLYDGTIYWGNASSSSNSSVVHTFSATKKSLPNSISLNGKTIVNFGFERFDKYSTYTIPSLKLTNIAFYSTAGNLEKEINLNFYRHKDYFFLDKLKIFRRNKLSFDFMNEYVFDYYSKNNLPDETTIGIDEWGYWNNRASGKLIPNFSLNKNTDAYYFTEYFRESNTSLCSTGLLKSIIYPTQGKSSFIYEPHKYSEKIDRTYASQFKNILVPAEGFIGGGRVSKIINYSNEGLETGTKEYKYISNYSPQSGANKSSGILSNYYRNLLYTVEESPYQTTEKLEVYSDNIIETAMNSFPVLYSEVTEIDNNKGYTKFFFTDFKTHPDLNAFNAVANNLNPVDVTYKPNNLANINLPYRSNNYKRGKIFKQEFFDQNFNKLKSSLTEFIDVSEIRPNNYITYVTDRAGIKYFLKLQGGSFDTGKTTIDEYFNSSILTTKNEYFYHSANGLNLSKLKSTDIDGTISETNFQYAHDKNNQKLIAANIVEVPLEILRTKIDNSVSKTLSKTETIFPDQNNYPSAQAGNLLLPVSSKSYDMTGSNSYQEITYDLYDDKGNLLQYTTREGVPVTIIWGYDQMQPIAKIEGISYADLANKLNFPNTRIGYKQLNIVSASDSDNSDSYEKQTLLPLLDGFRTNDLLKEYQISTYTFDPQVGVKSITNATGIRDLFTYDNANRLEKIQDSEENTLKEYKYNYAPRTFYSEELSPTLYKNDCPSWKIGGPYTYRVPENKYTSIISQADANQKAQNEVNLNGQNAANANGSCMFVSCNFVPNYYVNVNYTSIQQTAPNHISLILTYQANPPSGMAYNTGGVSVGYIGSSCRPSSLKSINSGSWNITITTDGYVIVKSITGQVPPANSPVGFSVEYDK